MGSEWGDRHRPRQEQKGGVQVAREIFLVLWALAVCILIGGGGGHLDKGDGPDE